MEATQILKNKIAEKLVTLLDKDLSSTEIGYIIELTKKLESGLNAKETFDKTVDFLGNFMANKIAEDKSTVQTDKEETEICKNPTIEDSCLNVSDNTEEVLQTAPILEEYDIN